MPMPRWRPISNIMLKLILTFFIGLSPVPAPQALPTEFVTASYGQYIQGGMVIYHLQPDTRIFLDGEEQQSRNQIAVIGFGRDAAAKSRLHFIRGENNFIATMNIAKRDYDIQHIDGVAPKYVSPPPDTKNRIAREGKQKRAALAHVSAHTDFAKGFQWPVRGRITGVYGSQRFYNGEARRPHYGIDIAAPAGTPVRAAASGRVSLAANMYFEGGLIFIDHGLGVTSAYLHLADMHVQNGDMVEAGAIIGTIGSTGRSTGPHLDWRLFWRGRRLDPALILPAGE